MIENQNSNEYTPCCVGDDHQWIYNNHGVEIPEGTSCLCGKKIAHYDICGKCGHKTLNSVPLSEEHLNNMIEVLVDKRCELLGHKFYIAQREFEKQECLRCGKWFNGDEVECTWV